MSGRIIVSPIILEEVAHNAWISERDFRETESLLGKLRPWELKRYIKNPFVRTFHYLEGNAGKWPMFIGQYRGNSPGDYSKILRMLRQRLKVELLPSNADETLSAEITLYLRRLSTSYQSDDEHLEDILYKLERDGKLLASVAAARATSEATGFESPMVILSSSSALVSAELKFKEALGEARLVLNKRAFSYLLSTIPLVSLGADTLRRALFTFGSHGRLRSDGTKALRLIRAAGEVDIPWAERYTLRQELSRSLKLEAEKRGVSKKDLTMAFVNGTVPEISTRLIVDSLRNLAIPTRLEQQLLQANKRIAELEARIASSQPISRGAKTTPKSKGYKRNRNH